jgi:hypothetical protein
MAILTKAYAEYHAQCWAESRTEAEIHDEIQRLEAKALHHTYKWDEVGCAQNDYDTISALKRILEERA